jgi:hypothetical protein
MTMQTGPTQLIESVSLTLRCDDTFKTVPVSLKDLEMLLSDDNYIIYKSEHDTEYCKANTLIVLDLNTKTIRTTNIPTDPHADAIKIYRDDTTCEELIFVATLDNDINIYNFTSGQHIKKLNACGTDYAYLINKIYIFKPDATNMFVLTDNYKYNSIWHYNPTDNNSCFIPYPEQLQNTIYYVYIDEVDKKVYLYSSYRLIVFTDLTFQNYKVLCESNDPVFSNIHPFKIGKHIHFGYQKIDAVSGTNITPPDSVSNTLTYKLTQYNGVNYYTPVINMSDYYKSKPCFANRYILFNTEYTIHILDYNLNSVGIIPVYKDEDLGVNKIYARGNKVFCIYDDDTITTFTIYCTKQDAADMNKFLKDCQLLPQELIINVMEYVGVPPSVQLSYLSLHSKEV